LTLCACIYTVGTLFFFFFHCPFLYCSDSKTPHDTIYGCWFQPLHLLEPLSGLLANFFYMCFIMSWTWLAHACDPSTREAEAEGPRVPGQTGLLLWPELHLASFIPDHVNEFLLLYTQSIHSLYCRNVYYSVTDWYWGCYQFGLLQVVLPWILLSMSSSECTHAHRPSCLVIGNIYIQLE
jgi:hypothetical protein